MFIEVVCTLNVIYFKLKKVKSFDCLIIKNIVFGFEFYITGTGTYLLSARSLVVSDLRSENKGSGSSRAGNYVQR